MPVRHVLVRDTRRDVEHYNPALSLNVISIAKTTKLLLPGGVPHVEADRAKICGERQRVYFHTESR